MSLRIIDLEVDIDAVNDRHIDIIQQILCHFSVDISFPGACLDGKFQ